MAKAKKKTAPPPAPTVGDMIIHYLQLEGVTHVFGIPGGGLMNMLVTFKNNRNKIEYVITRHETGAAYIADGYHRATGKLGVVVTTSGPGATNALTGVMNAQSDGSALMLLSGEVDEKFFGEGYLQEGTDSVIDINKIYAAATGFSAIVSTGSNAETLMKQALRTSLSIPHRATHLSLPVNVTALPLASPGMSASSSVYRANVTGPDTADVQAAMTALLACKRPVLFLGNGCREALRDNATQKALKLFVETYAIPVITTADAKGVFPESHDLSLRIYGIASSMWPSYYLTAKDQPYDGIMVIGSGLSELSTNSWLPMLKPQVANAPFIQVDADQRIIARSFEVTQGVVVEAGGFIRTLAALIPANAPNAADVAARKKAVAKLKQNSPFYDPKGYASTKDPIHPAAIMRVLQKKMPADTRYFIDCANCVGWSDHYLAVDPPSTIFNSLDMGPMGFGVCSVIGGKLGCPENTCVSICGDGAFMMFGAEVNTAAQYGVGAIWIVLNDNNLGMVSQGMNQFFPDDKNPEIWKKLYTLGAPDLSMYARGLGADAYDVNSPEDLEGILPKVLKRANLERRPQVIVAHIDPKPVPPYYNETYMPAKPPAPKTKNKK